MRKNSKVYFFLCLFLGWAGVHRFYAHKPKTGLLWLFTFGLGIFGWAFDLIVAAWHLFDDKRAASRIAAVAAERLPDPSARAGMKLAYTYNDVRFFPPVEMVSAVPQGLLVPGAVLTLRKEPENKYDNHAVAIYCDGHQIGYLHRNKLQDMANGYLAKGWPVDVMLDSLQLVGGEYSGFISMRFYRPNK